ncbi:MAG TPA: glycosyltransferase family 9 protein [Methylomirabilota bacterium]|nr:glycosyltransferase family 9 protein [Methylomirabilota bacterium]
MGAPTLAIHPGALGDVLLAVPALRALRAGSGAIMLAAQPRLGALLAALGVVDDHVAFDALGLDALFVDEATARPRLPDLARLVCWFGARDPVFVRRLNGLIPGAVVAPPAGHDRPVWEHLLATVGAPPGQWCDPIAAPAALRALRPEPADIGPPPWLLVHPGAGSPAKCWPAEAFARVVTTVAARARMNVLVHQGPADTAAAAALRRHLGAGVVWLVDPPLPALAAALSRAHAYLGNDSGVSHLAAALGVPALVLFDAPHLAWRPWWAGARVRTVTLAHAMEGEVDAVIGELLGMLR